MAAGPTGVAGTATAGAAAGPGAADATGAPGFCRIGTGIVAETGQDTTGAFLDEMPNTESIVERATWIVANRKPVYVDNQPINWTSMDFKTYSALGVPLATDGKTVDKIIYQMAFS